MSHLRLILAILCTVLSAPAGPLVWTPKTNHVETPHLLTNLITHFNYTNTSSEPVVVLSVEPSCHCTTPKIPKLPWTIEPHAAGKMEVEIEIPGKWGLLQKSITIRTAADTNVLKLEVDILEPDPRTKNRLTAFADRQAVFKGDCASCHVKPIVGLQGEALFHKACGICHESQNRATMVPDLAAKPHGDVDYWRQWVRIGKPGTFMPGFDKPHGGPLSEDQIASLVEFLQERFPPTPGVKPALPLQ
jgi:mono/diheme cytochrome c family protein